MLAVELTRRARHRLSFSPRPERSPRPKGPLESPGPVPVGRFPSAPAAAPAVDRGFGSDLPAGGSFPYLVKYPQTHRPKGLPEASRRGQRSRPQSQEHAEHRALGAPALEGQADSPAQTRVLKGLGRDGVFCGLRGLLLTVHKGLRTIKLLITICYCSWRQIIRCYMIRA